MSDGRDCFRSENKMDACENEYSRIVGGDENRDLYVETLPKCADAEIREALKRAARK